MLMLRRHQSQEFVTIVTLAVLLVVGIVTVALACFLYRRWRMLRRRHVLLHGSVLDFDSDDDEAGADGDVGTYAGPDGNEFGDAGRRAGASGWRQKRLGKFARLAEGTASLPAACRQGLERLVAFSTVASTSQDGGPESVGGAADGAGPGPSLPGIDDVPPAAPERQLQLQLQLKRQTAAGFDTFSSDLHRFRVAKPRGWLLEAAASTESVVVRFATPRRAAHYQRFTVTWEDVSWAATQPEKFARSLAAELRRDVPGAAVVNVAPYLGTAAKNSPSGAWQVEYTVKQTTPSRSEDDAAADAGPGLRLLTVILMTGRGRARAGRAQSWARAFSLSFAADAPAFEAAAPLMTALLDSFVVDDAAHHLDAEAWIDGGTSSLADTPPESPRADAGYLPAAFTQPTGATAAGGAGRATPGELASAAAAKARGMATSAAARGPSTAVAIPIRSGQRDGPLASASGRARRQSSTDDAASSWAAAAISMPPLQRGGAHGRQDGPAAAFGGGVLPGKRAAVARPVLPSLPRLEATDLGKAGMSVALPASWTASSAVSPTAAAASTGPRVDLTLQAPLSSAHWRGCSVRLVCVDLTPLAVRVDGTRALADQWAAHFEQQVAAGKAAGSSAMVVVDQSRVSTDTTRFSLRPGDGSNSAVALTVVGLHYRADSVFGFLLTASGPGGGDPALRSLADAIVASMADCALAS